MDIEQLRRYLDNALDGLGNAISILEDANQQPGTLHALRVARAEVINIIDMIEVADTGSTVRIANIVQDEGEYWREMISKSVKEQEQ